MNNIQDSLLAFIPEAVVTIAMDQRILDFNRMAEAVFGYSREEIVGQPLETLIPLGARAAHQHHVARFEQAPATAYMMHGRREVTGMRRDGSLFPAEASILKAQQGGEPVIIAVLRDVSARRAAQAKTIASERKHRAIMEGSPDAILMVDMVNGRILDANAAAGELIGCAPASLIGRLESELHPAGLGGGLVALFEAGSHGDRLVAAGAMLHHSSGVLLPVEVSARRIELDEHAVLTAFYRDIRHHHEREARLQHALEQAAESARSKSLFLANMSHELRTPLNGIIGFAEMIALEINGPLGHGKYREYGNLIVESAGHLLSLVNDILDFSALEIGKYRLHREVVSLLPLIEECLRLVQGAVAANHLDLRVEAPPDASLLADRRGLRQMLLNLLSNAVKYTPEDGSILVRVEQDVVGTAISVCDNGPGIDAERLAQVLEPFGIASDVYTRRRGGAGLGLSITKMLVELHGGRLSISQMLPGQQPAGTRAALYFPATQVMQD
ncbi:PAS domain S-box protein [Ferrovibrio sp.]|uniref:sensor histidine kinase n=1 Tax=Ferrovibrio sp. TaxID=1917215 RepID=UPI001B69EABA|nr:PAS domain S-box protein [Ferrovibrio sp.]MBP7063983.1 PAS domain S-box protein [Ferrovibrio sp.]